MATPYIGEIRMVGFNFAPVGWAFCDGSTIAIDQNSTLYTLIGTTYGGDGVQTFKLPDLQSRMPLHMGTAVTGTPYVLGQSAGLETVTLSTPQLPLHTHPAGCSDTASANGPSGQVWAATAASTYTNAAPNQSMHPAATGPAGGNLPHENLPPFLAINFIIALEGVFPSQN